MSVRIYKSTILGIVKLLHRNRDGQIIGFSSHKSIQSEDYISRLRYLDRL